MDVLLLSPYDAESHKIWREGLVNALPEFRWSVLTMPARHFSWRIRGNAMHLAVQIENLGKSFDLVVATSMTDLATLKGLSPQLSNTPAVLYFHENQFEYPITRRAHKSLEPVMVTLFSAMAANCICFNSRYNCETFFSGTQQLLNKFPDFVPKDILARLQRKSKIQAVPLSNDIYLAANRGRVPRERSTSQIVWNHRWEYDKGPERLLSLVRALPRSKRYTFNIIGQQFSQAPEVFDDIKSELACRGWLGHWGYIESRQAYIALLQKSHMVLSTALHDFQGLSVLEATALGCLPVVPDRLAYREFIPAQFRYKSVLNTDEAPSKEAQAAAELISRLADESYPSISIPDLSWHTEGINYAKILAKAAA